MFFRLKRALKRSFWLRFIYWLAVLNFVDLAVLLERPPRPAGARRTVLFIKMDGIGDYVIWESLYPLIESLYPASEFEKVLVGNSAWRELASGEDIFERKIFVDNSAFAMDPVYRYRTQKRIRRVGAGIALTPRMTRDFLWGDSMVRCSGAERRIGSEGIENMMTRFQQRISDRWYTRLIEAPAADEHELLSIRHFLEIASGNESAAEAASSSDIARIDGHQSFAEPYAVLFLGASNAEKLWSVSNFAKAAEHLRRRYDLRIVLAGGHADKRLADSFKEKFDGEFSDMVGKTSLASLRDLICGSSLVLSNDTSAAHISTFERVPTVVITPGDHIGRYFPYPDAISTPSLAVYHPMPCFGCGTTCIFTLGRDQAKPCVENVEIRQVVDAIDTLLGNVPPYPNGDSVETAVGRHSA